MKVFIDPMSLISKMRSDVAFYTEFTDEYVHWSSGNVWQETRSAYPGINKYLDVRCLKN